MKSQVWLKYLTCIAIFLSSFTASARVDAAAMSYQLNETLEVSTTGAWDRATIIDVGAAGSEHEGQYKVHFIGYAASYDRWLSPAYFRKLTPKADSVTAKAAYQLDERIEVNTTGAWDKATIIDVGTTGGEHEGEYKVHFEGYAASYDRWLLPVYIRKVAGGEPTASAATRAAVAPIDLSSVSGQQKNTSSSQPASAPRLGHYQIMSYGTVGKPPLSLGDIELLAGGKYRVAHQRNGDAYGEGSYRFDTPTSTLEWLSGPCKDNGWSGRFSIEQAGKTHKIRLRYSTTATNNDD